MIHAYKFMPVAIVALALCTGAITITDDAMHVTDACNLIQTLNWYHDDAASLQSTTNQVFGDDVHLGMMQDCTHALISHGPFLGLESKYAYGQTPPGTPESVLVYPDHTFEITNTPVIPRGLSPERPDRLGDLFGASVAIIGDLDGDYISDVAVGSPGYAQTGKVDILFMNADRTIKEVRNITSATIQNHTIPNNARFGLSVAGIGDINDDGVPDIAVGSAAGGAGSVYVLFMQRDGTVGSLQTIGRASGIDIKDGEQFGSSVAGIGDINDDGVPDIAVGAPRDNHPRGNLNGAVHTIQLNSDGTVKATQEIDFAAVGTDLISNRNFGASVAAIGDINEDGIPDIAVGAPGSSVIPGAVHIISLTRQGDFNSHIARIDNASNPGIVQREGSMFGASVASIGDLGLDGYNDLLVGAPHDAGTATTIIDSFGVKFPVPKGAVYYIPIGRDGATGTIIRLDDHITNGPALDNWDNFGASIAVFDTGIRGGLPDILVGSPRNPLTPVDAPPKEPGTVHAVILEARLVPFHMDRVNPVMPSLVRELYSYNNSLEFRDPSTVKPFYGCGNMTGMGLGTSVVQIGDLDGNGAQELALGMPNFDEDTGQVCIVFFNERGGIERAVILNDSPHSILPLEKGGLFGHSIAGVGDINGDMVPDIMVGAPGFKSGDVKNAGLVYIIHMKSDGDMKGVQVFGAIGENVQNTRFGYSIANIGDLNGNGRDEVFIGRPNTGLYSGTGYIIFTDTWNVVTINSDTKNGPQHPKYNGTLDADDATYFGGSVAGIGDIDRDGIPDIAVGSRDLAGSPVYIIFLKSDGSPKSTVAIRPEYDGPIRNTYGVSVAGIGDIDRDGIPDIAVGERWHNQYAGALHIHTLNQNGSVKDTVLLTRGSPGIGNIPHGGHLGSSVAGLGDINRDGMLDVAIGADPVSRLDAEHHNLRMRILSFDKQAYAYGASFATPDGHYKAGDRILIDVHFTEPIALTGTGNLQLGLDGLGNPATRHSASRGAEKITFSYVVGAGDYVTDLNYASESAIRLGGSSIKTAYRTVAETVSHMLPPPELRFTAIPAGRTGPLALNGQITLDAIPPSIQITSPAASERFGINDTITVTADATDNESDVSESIVWTDHLRTTQYGTGSSIVLSYNESGRHTVVATVTDMAGNTASATHVITVERRVTPVLLSSHLDNHPRLYLSNDDPRLELTFSAGIDATRPENVDMSKITLFGQSDTMNLVGASADATENPVVRIRLTEEQRIRAIGANPYTAYVGAGAVISVNDVPNVPLEYSAVLRVFADDTGPSATGASLVTGNASGTLLIKFDEVVRHAAVRPGLFTITNATNTPSVLAPDEAVILKGATTITKSDNDQIYIRLTPEQASAVADLDGTRALRLDKDAVRDISSNSINRTTIPLAVSGDTTRPNVVSAHVNVHPSVRTLHVYLDEAIDRSLTDTSLISISDSGSTSQVSLAGASVLDPNTPASHVSIKMSRQQAAGVAAMSGAVLSIGQGAFADLSGLQIASTTVALALQSDTAKPLIKSAVYQSRTGQIVVDFDEDVSASFVDFGKLSLLDPDGSNATARIPLDGAALASASDGDRLRIILGPGHADAIFALNHTHVKLDVEAGAFADLALNRIASTSLVFASIYDDVAPQAIRFGINSDGVLSIHTNENLDLSSVRLERLTLTSSGGSKTLSLLGAVDTIRGNAPGMVSFTGVQMVFDPLYLTELVRLGPSPTLRAGHGALSDLAKNEMAPTDIYEGFFGLSTAPVFESPQHHLSVTLRTDEARPITPLRLVADKIVEFSIQSHDADMHCIDPQSVVTCPPPLLNASGYLVWTPSEDQGGTGHSYEIVLAARDLSGQTAYKNITVNVDEVNEPPRIVQMGPYLIDGTRQGQAEFDAVAGTAMSFALNASDADRPRNTLTFSRNGTAGMIDSATGVFLWTPKTTDVGRTYHIEFTAHDGAASDSAVAVIDVLATLDVTRPVVMITGDNPLRIFEGQSYDDSDVTCTDDRDGSGLPLVRTGNVPNASAAVGTYMMSYTCTDRGGNTAIAQTRTVLVESRDPPIIPDTTPPVVSVMSVSPVEATGSNTLVIVSLPDVQDDTDSSNSISIATNITGMWKNVTAGVSHLFPVGVNSIYWRATDTSGNSNITMQSITIQDTTAPTIVLNGKSVIMLLVGQSYAEANAACNDLVDPVKDAIASPAGGAGPVDTSTIGTYMVSYSCSDLAGNNAEPVLRTVIVMGFPGAPTGLATTHGNGQVWLEWMAPADDGNSEITDYAIEYRAKKSGTQQQQGQWILLADDTSNATTATITGLTNGQEYEFRVYATNYAGTGVASGAITETPRLAPGAPGGLAATPLPASIRLDWNTPADDGGSAITDYVVEYRIASGNTVWIKLEDGTSSLTMATVANLTNGQKYEFRVYAVNGEGRGIPSAEIAAAPRDIPGAPTGLESTPESASIRLSWIAPANNGGDSIYDYTIQYRQVGGAWAPFADGTSNATNATVTGLVNGQEYEFRVYAKNAAGSSIPTDAITATPYAMSTMPRNIVAIPADGRILLEWGAPADDGGSAITDYVVEYRIAGGNTAWIKLEDDISNDTDATVTNLTNGQKYEFRVYAVNDLGPGIPTVIIYAIPRGVPGAPTGLAAEITTDRRGIHLSWTAPSDTGGTRIIDYITEYSTDGRSWSVFADGIGNATSAVITGLTNGQAYEFRVYAVNDAGGGVPSNTISATPRDVPDAPTGLTSTYGNEQVRLEWTAPAAADGDDNSNNMNISDYYIEYKTSREFQWQQFEDGTSNTTMATVLGLTNGQAYEFRVSAVNEAGRGPPSGIATATPRPVPGAPQGVTAAPEDSVIRLSWTAPIRGGGLVTGYVVEYRNAAMYDQNPRWTTYSDAGSIIITTTSATIASLTNGQPYEFRVYATNDAGRGTPSSMVSATPRDVPGAPTGLVGVPGNEQVWLEWSAPADDGGNTISDYIIQYRTAGSSDTAWVQAADGASDATMATVLRLTNGQPYEFRVYATNDAGNGTYSAVVSATPRPVPGAPQNLAVTPASASIHLDWDAPAHNGGSTITDYVIEYRRAGSSDAWMQAADGASDATMATVTNLANGQPYEFRVSAVNDAGRGVPSDPIQATPRGVPGAPLDLKAGPTSTSAMLFWQPPTHDGGADITNYVIEYRTAGTGQQWKRATSVSSETTITTITGLTNGQSYEFRVYAINGVGSGAPSGIVTVTPQPVPGASQNLVAEPSDSAIRLSWTAPAGGSGDEDRPITGYIMLYRNASTPDHTPEWITYSNAGSIILTTATLTITGLTNGQAYEFCVYAVNDAGRGIPSGIITSTPRDVPSAPTSLAGIPGNEQAWLGWSAPADDGGNAIFDYMIEYRTSGGQWLQSKDDVSDAETATVTGLTNGQAYEFRVSATNDAGNSPYSAVISVTPQPAPDAPLNLAASPASSSMLLGWVAPVGNGDDSSVIIDYAIEYRTIDGGAWMTFADGMSKDTIATVTNLINGQEYEFRVYAINSVGSGIPSNIATGTPRDVPSAPLNIMGIPGNGQVWLSWDAPTNDGGDDIHDYAIEYRVTGLRQQLEWTQSADGISNATTATVMGLENNKTYEIRVYAINDAGSSSASDVITAMPHPVPGKPLNLAAEPMDSSILLSWAAPVDDQSSSSVTHYEIEYRAIDGGAWMTFADGTSHDTIATVTNLANGQKYEFRVYAINSVGNGIPSDSIRATPRSTPGAPANLVAIHGNGQVLLSWDAPVDDGGDDIHDYMIEYRDADTDSNNGAWTQYADGTSSATTATVTGLENNKTYELRVYAINDAGSSSASDVVTAMPHPVPGKPLNLAVEPMDSGILLSWVAPVYDGGHGIEGYAIEYRMRGDSAWVAYDYMQIINSTFVVVKPLQNGLEYEFRAYAISDVGRSIPSNVVVAIPIMDTARDQMPPGIMFVTEEYAVVADADSGLARIVMSIPVVSDDQSPASDIVIATNITGTWQTVTSDFEIILQVGTHTVYWRATDAAGNHNTAHQYVIIGAATASDGGAPTIQIIGSQSMTLATGDVYEEQGATCSSSGGQGLDVNIHGDRVNTAVPGTYQVYYTCTDPDGKGFARAVRTVTVTVTVDHTEFPQTDPSRAGTKPACR